MDSANRPQPGRDAAPPRDDRAAGQEDRLGANLTVIRQPVAPAEHHTPVWMARTMMVVFVAFCVEIGLVLFAVPWIPHLWHENPLLAGWTNLRAFLAHDFVRGAVSGIGLLDIWIGIYEAVHYRDPQ